MRIEELTVGQYDDLQSIYKGKNPDDTECIRKVVHQLYGVDIEDVPFIEASILINNAVALVSEPIPDKPLRSDLEYRLNGHRYRLNVAPATFTSAQFQDIIDARDKGYADILAAVLLPVYRKGFRWRTHKYNDGYDFATVLEDVRQMPITDAKAISGFFFRWSRIFRDNSLSYLKQKLQGVQLEEETRSQLDKALQTLSSLLESSPSC